MDGFFTFRGCDGGKTGVRRLSKGDCGLSRILPVRGTVDVKNPRSCDMTGDLFAGRGNAIIPVLYRAGVLTVLSADDRRNALCSCSQGCSASYHLKYVRVESLPDVTRAILVSSDRSKSVVFTPRESM